MAEELKDPRLIETYVHKGNSERERLIGDTAATHTRLEAKRDRIEGERQRNIDLVIRYVIYVPVLMVSPQRLGRPRGFDARVCEAAVFGS
jgi:hypothetical protein